MKQALILGIALAMSQLTFAQNTITGTVVDEKGNPMPGVKVETSGKNPQTVLTNMDGTFTIESDKPKEKLTSTYVGWSTASKKGKDGVVIKMHKGNKNSYDHYQWFVGLTGAFPTNKIKDVSPGIMFGRVKNVGWYLKGQTNGVKHKDGHFEHSKSITTIKSWDHDLGYDAKAITKYWSAVLGGLVRVAGPVYVNLGFGYSQQHHFLEISNYENEKQSGSSLVQCDDCTHDSNIVLDAGLMVRIKNFFVQGGIQLNKDVETFDDHLDDGIFKAGTIAVGITF